MTTAAASPRRRHRRRGAPRGTGRRLVRMAAAVPLVIVLVGLAYYAGLAALVGNQVGRVDVLRPDGPGVRSQDDPAQVYLLVGTGLGEKAGSGTTMVLLHVPPGEDRAVAVILPARAYVDVPACRAADGRAVEPFGAGLETVLATGDAGCLVDTVQQLTGLAIDHYVQFDLGALADVVQAVGAVAVCLPTPVPQVGLPAGDQRLDGTQALALLGSLTGDGAPRRIQERLLGAVAEQVSGPDRVLDPLGTTRMLRASAAALTLDEDTGWGDLQRLVRVLRGLGSDRVQVVAAPVGRAGYRPVDGSAPVDLLDPAAGRALFASLAAAGPPDAVARASAPGGGTC